MINIRFVVVLLCIVTVALAGNKFGSRLDNINIQEVLNNERLLKNYIECLLANTEGRCTPEGKELRVVVPDALSNGCSECSEKQKEGAVSVIDFLKTRRQEVFQKLLDKYDPDGVYRKDFEEKLRSQ